MMLQRLRSATMAVALVASVNAGCGSSQDAETCEGATAAAAKNLDESLTAEAGKAKLGKVIAIPVEDTSDAPVRGFVEGTTLLASTIKVPGSDGRAKTVRLVWVAGAEFANTGGGLAVGADYTTKSLSELGTAARLDSPVAEYVTTVYDEHQDDVVACLNAEDRQKE